MLPNRRVHAECEDFEVVRYERSGKWWLEPRGFGVGKSQLNVRQAAEKAVEAKGRRLGAIHLGEPGGNAFDREVQRLLGA